MPILNLQMLSGRSSTQKRALIYELNEVITRNLEVPGHAVVIVLTEVDQDHWAVGGKTIEEIRDAT